jgi:hypothetical protein
MGIGLETVELNTRFKRKLQLKKAENRRLFRHTVQRPFQLFCVIQARSVISVGIEAI